MAINPDPVPRGPVTATLNFSYRPPVGQPAINYVEDPPPGEPKHNLEVNPQPVLINDIRGHESEFKLDTDAFQAVSNVAPSEEIEIRNDESIQKNYYPEVEQFLLDKIPDINRIFLFDHTIRRSDPDAKRAPVQYTRIDQTPVSAPQRVRRHMGEDAESLLKGRYRIVNGWRTLN